MKTPLGVMILAIIAIAIGIMDVIWSLRLMGYVTFGPGESGDGIWLSGLFTMIVGLIWLSAGFALVSLRPWALMFVEILAIFGLVNAVFAMFASGSIATGVGLAILPGFIFWYANRESVTSAFMNSGNV
jgi:hypothetical protein